MTVGQPEAPAPKGPLPEFVVSPPKAAHDFSGPKVHGTVSLKSKTDQQHLILFAMLSLILAGGSFTCHSGDDNNKTNRHAELSPAGWR